MHALKTRYSLVFAACLTGAAAHAAIDPAQWRSCNASTASAESIAACDRLLAGGELSTAQIVQTTSSRALARHVGGESGQAIAELDALVARFPGNPKAEAARAAILMYAKRFDAAEASARRAIDLDDTMAGPHFVLATVLGERGDAGGALVNAAKAAALGPGLDFAQNDYCWRLAVANRELDKALAACDRAVELTPISPHFDSRGLVHFRLGEYSKAVADYDAAVSQGDSEDSRYVRGLAKQALGDVAGGQADIAAALQSNPEIAGTYAAWGIGPEAASDLKAAETEYAKARFIYRTEMLLYQRRAEEAGGDDEEHHRLELKEAQIEALGRQMEAAKQRVVALGGNPDAVARWLPPPPPPPNRPATGTASAPAVASAAPAPALVPDTTAVAPRAASATNARGIAAARARHDEAVRDLATAHEDIRRTRASGVHLPDVIVQLEEEVVEAQAALRDAKADLDLAQSPAATSPQGLQRAREELARDLAALQVAEAAYDDEAERTDAEDDRLWRDINRKTQDVRRSRNRLEALGG